MSNGYRTLSQHLNDLKKENFSLKLRIYFLEERIQQKYEESSEDVYRTVSSETCSRPDWLVMKGDYKWCKGAAPQGSRVVSLTTKRVTVTDVALLKVFHSE